MRSPGRRIAYRAGGILCLLLMSSSVRGEILYVDTDAPGANTGANWTDAYRSLQDALAHVGCPCQPVEIRVAQGVYRPDQGAGVVTGDRQATFQLRNKVTLKGGYAGYGESDPDARDIEEYETILSGDLAGNDEPNFVNNDENSYNVVTGYQTDTMDTTTDVLDGFIVAGGNANSPSYPHNFGGGMLCNSDATVRNCIFTGNSASYGGGMCCRPSWCCVTLPTLTNCVFISNSAGDEGGGLWIGDSDPILTNCMISSNAAANNGGGIMFGNDNFPTLINCQISGNSAGQDGGGMFCDYTFWGMFMGCIYSGNSAEQNGGGVFCTDDSLGIMMSNCTFIGNAARDHGGGICEQDGSDMTLTNCILWGDLPEEISGEWTAWITVNHCCIQGGWPGEGNIDTDPLFVAPGYRNPNDTPGNPNDDFWVEGDYHLKSQAGRWDAADQTWVMDTVTSPCIDAGDAATPIGWEPFPNGGIVNMGAYGGTNEASKSWFGKPNCATPIAGDINGDCVVDMRDLVLIAYHWLEESR